MFTEIPDEYIPYVLCFLGFVIGALCNVTWTQRKRINELSCALVRERATFLEARESEPSQRWLFLNGKVLVDRAKWSRMASALKELERDAEWCKAHMHEFQIGAAIEKACRDLPELYHLDISLENGAGMVTLCYDSGPEWEFSEETFAEEIGAAVVKAAAHASERKKPAEKWSEAERALLAERNHKPLTLNKIEGVKRD